MGLNVVDAASLFADLAVSLGRLQEVRDLAVLAFGEGRVSAIEHGPDGFDSDRGWESWAFSVTVNGRSVWAWVSVEHDWFTRCVDQWACGIWVPDCDDWRHADDDTAEVWFAMLRDAVLTV